MDLEYKLQISSGGITFKDSAGNIITDASKAFEFTNKTSNDGVYNQITITFSLYGLSFSRKMYEPGHIEAELLLAFSAPIGDEIDDAWVRTMLIGRSVNLLVSDVSTAKTITNSVIAQNYYIHALSPQLEARPSDEDLKGKDSISYNIYVKLDIFSIDKQMTLNAYSKVYLAKKLKGDIFSDAVGTNSIYSVSYDYQQGTAVKTASLGIPAASTSHKMNNLTYGDSATEYMHPYLVQYNESLYDFIRRVANRCGEAFYFEDGVPCFGLPANGSVKTITTAKRYIYNPMAPPSLSVDAYSRDSIKGMKVKRSTVYEPEKYNSEAIKNQNDHFPHDAFSKAPYTYNSELAAEDQYILLYRNKFTRKYEENFKNPNFHLFWDEPDVKGLALVSDVLNSTSLLDMLADYTVQTIKSGAKYGMMKKTANDAGNTIINKTASDNDTYGTLFAKFDSDPKNWLTLNYYNDIKSNQESQMREMVCVDMGEGYYSVKLGDKIRFWNKDSATVYVVVQIELESKEEWQCSYDSYYGVSDKVGGNQRQRIYAIPLKGGVFYPPALPGSPFRQSGPQTAFVTDNEDPKGQGRVRVRFAWQPYELGPVDQAEDDMNEAKYDFEDYATDISYSYKYDSSTNSSSVTVTATKKEGVNDTDYNTYLEAYKTACKTYEDVKREHEGKTEESPYMKDSSPWIRMVTPMATAGGGGMYFRPEIGDEVMVNFENGNVDHPFVLGTLFSKNAPSPTLGRRSIVSKNGHMLRFIDPEDDSLFIAGAYPGYNLLRTYGLPVSFSVNENTHHALGGIELADTLGFYRVTMSSHNRNISLSSPFGDVNIDALTGISIKAPNGNIKIEGKNVEITANNRLTLTSGQNIKNGGFFDSISKGDAWKKKGADVLVDNTVAPFLDLSLLRTILEIFIRPIDGTLLIKSHRFMELEAGKGHANVPAAFYKPDETVGHKRRQLADELNVFMFLLSSVGNPLDKYVDEYVVLHNSVVKACNAFITKNNISGTATYRIPGFDNNNVGKLMKAVIAYAGDAKSFLNSQQYTQGYNFKSCKGDLLAPCEDLFKKTKQLKKYAALYGSKKLYTAWNDNMKDASLDKRFVRLFGVSNLENMADLKLETKWNQAGDPTNSMAIPQRGHFYDTIIHILNTTYINAQNAADGDAFFSTSLQASSYVRWKTLVKRIMAKALIDQVATGLFRNFTVVAGQYAPGQQPADPANPYTNSDWPKYFNGIIFQNRIKVDAGAKEIFAAKAMDTVKKASLFEINVWNETAKGEILFSNSADKTYRFGPNTVSGSANYEVSDTDDNDTLTKALRAALKHIV